MEKTDEIIVFVRKNTWLDNVIEHGWGNGYVAIPKSHPIFNKLPKDYNEIDVDIHGGLTFGEEATFIDGEITPIIGNVIIDKPYFVIGFDTVHFGDNMYKWTKEKVIEETKNLYDQILKNYF